MQINQVGDDFEIQYEEGVTTAMDVKAAFDCAGFAWWCSVSGDGSGVCGAPGVDSAVGGVDPVIPEGFALEANEQIELPIDRLSVWLVATEENQIVSWFGG